MSSDPLALRAYGALLRLYPRSFRDEYRDDLVQLVRDQCADEPAWRVWGRAAIDLAVTIPTQHLEAHMNRPPDHLVPLLYAAVAAGGALLAAVGGSNVATVVIGVTIALVAGAMAVVAWRRAGPIAHSASGGSWWKLVVAGPCIVATVIVAAGLGVDAWILGVVSVFVAFVLTGTGVLLGLARLVGRDAPTPTA